MSLPPTSLSEMNLSSLLLEIANLCPEGGVLPWWVYHVTIGRQGEKFVLPEMVLVKERKMTEPVLCLFHFSAAILPFVNGHYGC